MLFNSVPFLILILLTFLTVFAVRGKEKQMMVLLLASYVFYAYWDIRYLVLMIAVEYISYLFARVIQARKDRWILATGIILQIGALVYFKYFGFLVENVNQLFGIPDNGISDIVLPIGISFYTFQSISYLVDVWRGEIEARKRFREVSLYISFFPQLVAGPIMRAKDFLPQLDRGVVLSKKNCSEGIQIFTWGLFKKVVIADRLAVCVDSVFAAPKAYSGISLTMACISYSLQILCDFSGYSDMAIGTAKIFGFDLIKNFDLPYLSCNPSEFWRRWHISLSQWLRDYLYIPLGGNRKGVTRTYVNLVITMLIGGLWHGASWNFVIWGGIHGIALVVHRIYRSLTEKKGHSSRNSREYNAICLIVNNVFVCCCWVVFRLGSVEDIKSVFSGIVCGQKGITYIYVYTIVFVLITICYYWYSSKKKGGHSWYCILDLKKPSAVFAFSLFLWIIALFGYLGNNAYIYFQF